MVSSVTNGNFTLDASNFGGTIDINTITASGAVVVSMGTTGDFSADDKPQSEPLLLTELLLFLVL